MIVRVLAATFLLSATLHAQTSSGHQIGESVADFLKLEPSLEATFTECQATVALLDKDPDVYGDKCGALIDTLTKGKGPLYGNGYDPNNAYADNMRRRPFKDPRGNPLPQTKVSDGREFYFDNGTLSFFSLDLAADYVFVRDNLISILGAAPKEATVPKQSVRAAWKDITATWDTNELHVELFQADNPDEPSLPHLSVRRQTSTAQIKSEVREGALTQPQQTASPQAGTQLTNQDGQMKAGHPSTVQDESAGYVECTSPDDRIQPLRSLADPSKIVEYLDCGSPVSLLGKPTTFTIYGKPAQFTKVRTPHFGEGFVDSTLLHEGVRVVPLQNITGEFNKFKDVTSFSAQATHTGDVTFIDGKASLVDMDMTAGFACPGKVDLGCPISASSASLLFTATTKRWTFQNNRELILLIDGDPLNVGTTSWDGHVVSVGNGTVFEFDDLREYLGIDISPSVLIKLANAKTVDVNLGAFEFSLTEENLAVFKELDVHLLGQAGRH